MTDVMLCLRRAWCCQAELNQIAKSYAVLTSRKSTSEDAIAAVRGKIAAEGELLERCMADQTERLEQVRKLEAIRDRTQRVMEQGQILDYTTAEAQVKQLSDRIDEHEEETLTLMENQETMEQKVLVLREQLRHHTQKHGQVLAEEQQTKAKCEPRKEFLEAELLRESSDLPPDIGKRFLRNRFRHEKLVADLTQRSCGSCRMPVPSIAISDMQRLGRIYSCRNCSAFNILPVEEEESSEEEE
jgi:predicted  nucleic acid-binding Zn-ribbon protein